MTEEPRIITQLDQQRLDALLAEAIAQTTKPDEQFEAFRHELEHARIVSPQETPIDIVTMNSTISLYDADFDVTETYSLVYPSDADIFDNRLSILNPMGMAILGRRIASVIHWKNSNGDHRMELKDLHFQPEREGALHL